MIRPQVLSGLDIWDEIVSSCDVVQKKSREPLPQVRASLRLASPAFADRGSIPRRYTCDGPGTSPPLRWSGVPRRTRELALIVEDPDAGRFVHWSLLAIPAGTTELRE